VTTPPPAELTMLDLGKVVDIVAQALQDENEPRSIARRSGINDPRLPSGSTQSLDRWEPVFRAALEGSPETLAVLLKNIRRAAGESRKARIDYALQEVRISCVARVTRTAHLSLSDQIDDLSEAYPPGDSMTEPAQRLRLTVLSVRRLLMRPLLAETFLQIEQELGISYEDPERLRLQLAKQAMNVVTALDYLLTLLFTSATTSSQLVLASQPGADRTQGRTDEEASDWLTRRRLDARNTAVDEGQRLLVMLRRDIAFDLYIASAPPLSLSNLCSIMAICETWMGTDWPMSR